MLDLKVYLDADETRISNLLLRYYKVLGFTDQEFLLYIHLLQYSQKGEQFPDLEAIGKYMGVAAATIYQILGQLLDKNYIQIVTEGEETGKNVEKYDLSPVYIKIEHYLASSKKQKNEIVKQKNEKNLYQLFEDEFKRPLSPIEMETLTSWLQEDQYSVELIRLALKEAVLNQAYSFKYMDRILLSWERKNIKTVEQVHQEQKRRKNSYYQKDQLEATYKQLHADYPKVPLYNWLEPDKNSQSSQKE